MNYIFQKSVLIKLLFLLVLYLMQKCFVSNFQVSPLKKWKRCFVTMSICAFKSYFSAQIIADRE